MTPSTAQTPPTIRYVMTVVKIRATSFRTQRIGRDNRLGGEAPEGEGRNRRKRMKRYLYCDGDHNQRRCRKRPASRGTAPDNRPRTFAPPPIAGCPCSRRSTTRGFPCNASASNVIGLCRIDDHPDQGPVHDESSPGHKPAQHDQESLPNRDHVEYSLHVALEILSPIPFP